MPQFNPQQQEAIDILNKNIIVSASAGAGKTTVLIARLMKRILQDKVHISTICALTFTDAAAQEMKSRLLNELHQEYNTNKTSFLEEQIALVETAEITTIHSYCLSLIKNYGYIIGINQSRSDNILNDTQVMLLKKEAFNNVLNQWLDTRYDETYELLDYFSSNPIDFNALENAINDAATWLRSRKDQNKAINNVIDLYKADDLNQWPQIYQDLFFTKYEEVLSQALFHLNNIIGIVDQEAKTTTKPFKNNIILREKSDLITELLIQCKNHDITFYDSLIQAFDFNLITVRGSDAYKEAREPLVKLIEDNFETYQTLDHHFAINNELLPFVQNFISFSLNFIDEYQHLKELDNTLDFDDFEHYALEILNADNGAIAKELKNHYQEIMVDEFQDTNEIQDEIIRLISNGHNLFRVGDIKQSIYKFRGAKPQIMKKLMKDDDHKNLYLSYNYRSKEPIVMFNNDVFDKLMNETNESEYTKQDHVLCGLESQKENGTPVELHLFETNKETEYELTKNEQRAKHIAQQVIHHHHLGYDFKDMTVLIRSHAQKLFLKKAFEEVNIPHYMSEQTGFFNSEIVTAVMNLLRYSQNNNDYYLAQALLSPLFDFNENDLAILKLSGEGSFNQQLKNYNPSFYTKLMSMIRSWSYKDIVSILQEIYTLNNAYNEKLSIQDKTNLDFLLDKAIMFQEDTTPSIQAFLNFYDALEEQDDKTSEASHLSVEDDVVEAMTIHQSKGLQFPIVFYWGGGSLNVRDHHDFLVTDDDFGLAFNHLSHPYRLETKTLLRDLVEYKQTHEELEEMLRLLYVALTRPQVKLIVVDVYNEFEKKTLNSHLLLNYKRQADLLLAAANPENTAVMIDDASAITNKTLEDNTIWGVRPSFENLNISIEKTYHAIDLDSLDLNPQSKWAMDFGTRLHEAIEALPNERWDERLLDQYETPIKNRLLLYNQHPFTFDLYSFNTIEHELPFLFKDNDDIVSGIIDFVAINPDKIVIVDFKSDNADKNTLFERYEEQLIRYKKALDIIYPEHEIETYIYSFHSNEYFSLSL